MAGKAHYAVVPAFVVAVTSEWNHGSGVLVVGGLAEQTCSPYLALELFQSLRIGCRCCVGQRDEFLRDRFRLPLPLRLLAADALEVLQGDSPRSRAKPRLAI